jgi:hypothetical protein
MRMPEPMHGVRIVDLAQMISGPLGAMILADQGAARRREAPGSGRAELGASARLGDDRARRESAPALSRW